MNKSRQLKEFKDKELDAKRCSRKNLETQEKTRKSTLKSMNKSRQCKQFKDKELDLRKCSRQNPQTRENDRKKYLKRYK